MTQKSPEEILGLQPGASSQAIKNAFRKLARLNHPDLNPDNPQAGENFIRISDAYDQLSQTRSDLLPLTEESYQFDLSSMEFLGRTPEGNQIFHISAEKLKPVTPKSRRISPKE